MEATCSEFHIIITISPTSLRQYHANMHTTTQNSCHTEQCTPVMHISQSIEVQCEL